MPLSAYSLVSLEELKQVLSIDPAQAGQDPLLEVIIARSSEAIETFLGRQVVTRGSHPEYHSIGCSWREELQLREYPIATLTSVEEGEWVAGTWTPRVTLVEGTDFVKDAAAGRLIRLSGCWPVGREAIRVIYTAGYATTALVPGPIKDVCVSMAARKYGQLRRGGDFGAQTISDATGSVTRFLPAELLTMERAALLPWRQVDFGSTGRA